MCAGLSVFLANTSHPVRRLSARVEEEGSELYIICWLKDFSETNLATELEANDSNMSAGSQQ